LLSQLLLVSCLFLTSCARPPAPAPSQAATPVTVSYPAEREVTDYANFTARTAAVDTVEVRARVSGYVEQVKFKEGALVDKGDVLVTIDPRPYAAELSRALAQLEEAKAALTQSKTQLAEAQALEARTIAGLQYQDRRLERSKKLVPGVAISHQEFELQESEADQSKADLSKAQAQVASSRAAIATAQAAVQSAEAVVDLAKLNLEYTNVTAPISGRISRKLVTEGNLIQPGSVGGTPLTTIVSIDPIYAYFDVDERTVLRVRQLISEGKADSARDGTVPVQLALATEQGFPHEGVIDFVDNQVNPKTGTLRLRGVFRNSSEQLVPGMFGRVRVPIGRPHDALLVNERAIDNDQGQKILYVLNEQNEVTTRSIQVGALHAGLREVTAGLSAGDRVIVSGIQQVRPGLTVEPKLAEMPGSAHPSNPQRNSPAAIASGRSY